METTQDKVGRLRKLIAEAERARPPDAQPQPMAPTWAPPHWDLGDVGPYLDQAPEARARRAVLRVAEWYPWGPAELRRCLDSFGVPSLGLLDAERLDLLRAHMERLDDGARSGSIDPDGPGAW